MNNRETEREREKWNLMAVGETVEMNIPPPPPVVVNGGVVACLNGELEG